MVFSSLIFLWVFLPIIFIGYFLIQNKYKNILLFLGSLVFYAWGEPRYIWLMLCSILINYGIGLLMDKYENRKRILLISGIVINIGLLGYFKYFNFLIEILNFCTAKEIKLSPITLPIGISFFTFQILSYLIDLYRGHYKAQKNFIHLALYISFFPQLIAGPIVQYKDINEQLIHRRFTPRKDCMWNQEIYLWSWEKSNYCEYNCPMCRYHLCVGLYRFNRSSCMGWCNSLYFANLL